MGMKPALFRASSWDTIYEWSIARSASPIVLNVSAFDAYLTTTYYSFFINKLTTTDLWELT